MLKHFRIERSLGEGGFAFVYEAFDTQLGRRVAIKELFPTDRVMRIGGNVALQSNGRESERTWQWYQRKFIEEAKHLAKFRHPNIVQVTNYFSANNTAYIVMQLVKGRTLGMYRRELRRAPTEGELTPILTQILDGLEAVHGLGLLHRDIKPSNIIINESGSVVLIDFGIARNPDAPESDFTRPAGTDGYSPIEQLNSVRGLRPAADIYAVAATMVKIITGNDLPKAHDRRPNDPYQSLYARCKGRYSASLLKGIDAGMALDAMNRPQSIAQWRSILFGKSPPPPPPDKSSRAALIFALFVCLVVSFTAAWIAIRMGTQKSASIEAVGSKSNTRPSERIAILSPPQVAPIPPTLPSSPSQPAQSNKEPTKVAIAPPPPPNTAVTAATSAATNDLDRDLNLFLKDELEQPMRPQNYASRIFVNDSGQASDQKEMSRDQLVAEEARDEAKFVGGLGQFTHLGSKRLSYDPGTDTAEMRQIFSYDRTSKSTGARRFGLVIRQVFIEKAATKERCIRKRIVTARAIGYRCRLSKADQPNSATGSSQSSSNADMIRSILQLDRENVESRSHVDPEDMSFPPFRSEAARKKIAIVQDKQLILIPSGDESVQQIVSGTPVVDVFPDLEGPDPAIVIVVKP